MFTILAFVRGKFATRVGSSGPRSRGSSMPNVHIRKNATMMYQKKHPSAKRVSLVYCAQEELSKPPKMH